MKEVYFCIPRTEKDTYYDRYDDEYENFSQNLVVPRHIGTRELLTEHISSQTNGVFDFVNPWYIPKKNTIKLICEDI